MNRIPPMETGARGEAPNYPQEAAPSRQADIVFNIFQSTFMRAPMPNHTKTAADEAKKIVAKESVADHADRSEGGLLHLIW